MGMNNMNENDRIDMLYERLMPIITKVEKDYSYLILVNLNIEN